MILSMNYVHGAYDMDDMYHVYDKYDMNGDYRYMTCHTSGAT